MISVNTSINGLTSQTSLNKASVNLKLSMERLSSGLRINSSDQSTTQQTNQATSTNNTQNATASTTQQASNIPSLNELNARIGSAYKVELNTNQNLSSQRISYLQNNALARAQTDSSSVLYGLFLIHP